MANRPFYYRGTTLHHETIALSNALVSWLDSQNVDPTLAECALLYTAGLSAGLRGETRSMPGVTLYHEARKYAEEVTR